MISTESPRLNRSSLAFRRPGYVVSLNTAGGSIRWRQYQICFRLATSFLNSKNLQRVSLKAKIEYQNHGKGGGYCLNRSRKEHLKDESRQNSDDPPRRRSNPLIQRLPNPSRQRVLTTASASAEGRPDLDHRWIDRCYDVSHAHLEAVRERMNLRYVGRATMNPRQTLLNHNAGIWQGTFVRFDANGRECERFASHLEVADRDGTIHADLTNCSSGLVRSMQFSEPPPEMQVSPDGHWSLGPDRIGAWPWVCELCLVWGEQRRRVVVRHDSSSLTSFVVVLEGRLMEVKGVPTEPFLLQPPVRQERQQTWSLGPPFGITLRVMAQGGPGPCDVVCLEWQPKDDLVLQIIRRYSEHGLLLTQES